MLYTGILSENSYFINLFAISHSKFGTRKEGKKFWPYSGSSNLLRDKHSRSAFLFARNCNLASIDDIPHH